MPSTAASSVLAIVSHYGNAREEARTGLREWTLGHDPLRLCVPPDHPLAGASGCARAELAGEPWVMCPDTSLGRLVRGMCIAAVSAVRSVSAELRASVRLGD